MNRSVTGEIFNPIAWAKWLLGVVALSAILAFVPLVYDVGQEKLTPRDYWYTYNAVEPIKEVFQIGEPLVFTSSRDIRKTINVEWDDTLRCDTGTGDRTFSIYEAGKVLEPHFLVDGAWTYNALVPQVPAECYLISTTTAKLKYTKKVQTLISQKFWIR